MSNAFQKVIKILIILQNLASPYLTKDRIQENLLKVIKLRDKDTKNKLYHIGMQGNMFLPDLYSEYLDFNRHKLESLPKYISRVLNSN